eukprot:10931446-Alexandrium_andersonii.AAC.1
MEWRDQVRETERAGALACPARPARALSRRRAGHPGRPRNATDAKAARSPSPNSHGENAAAAPS